MLCMLIVAGSPDDKTGGLRVRAWQECHGPSVVQVLPAHFEAALPAGLNQAYRILWAYTLPLLTMLMAVISCRV